MTFILTVLISFLAFNCDNNSDPVIRDFGGDNTNQPVNTISRDTLRIPVVHHISRNNAGTNAAVTEERINKIMGDINKNFKSGKIQFFTKSINFINNTTWNTSFVKQDDFTESKVLSSFEDDKALNIFYFIKLLNRRNGEITGELGATALFPNQGNNLKLSASSVEIQNTATATHEIGHYLGLYHTDDDFKDSQGRIELVDGSNCTEAGDKICDTPASPDLNDSNIDEPSCNYIGTERDPAGMPYSPDTQNFMITWSGTDTDGTLCRRHFSQGQIEKMTSVLNNERAYLITRE
ncbi:M43 family zinc metalloprotease [Algibacter pectinivorans]|nr:M43 family zinc metalloprotease [Algibacter pectinivorans]